jgi:hypothetical protein
MSESPSRTAAPDPLIDEIRQYRTQLDGKFAGDWQAYGAFIREAAANIRRELSLKGAVDEAKDQGRAASR